MSPCCCRWATPPATGATSWRHESFEDEAIAAVMNDNFVNVKVDREERPDVDAVYMEATQAMTGHGGWPMTVFCTPEGEPFYCGTYFPPQPRHGMPSFAQVLTGVAEAWRDRREQVREVGATWPGGSRRDRPCPVGVAPPTAEQLDTAVRCSGRSSTTSTAGSAARRSSHRRWCSSSCCGTTPEPVTSTRCGWPS